MSRRGRIMDMQRLDPNWQFATNHGKATRPGVKPTSEANRFDSVLLCPCCLNMIQKQPVNLWENSKQLFFLGYGFPLFYNMLQFCIINLFILILTQSAVLMYKSVNEECKPATTHGRTLAGSQSTYHCHAPFVIISRVSTKLEDLDIQIRILSFIGQMFLLLNFRDNQRKLASYHVERNIRITDFSIIFKNLPKIKGIQKKIKAFLQNQFSNKHQVQQIFVIPKMEEFLQKQDQKIQIIQKKKKHMHDQSQHGQDLLQKMDEQIEEINAQLFEFCQQTQQKIKKDVMNCQKAIVVLRTQKEKVQVIDQFKNIDKTVLQKYFHWMADEVSLKQAPDPKEIIWQNINYPKNQRWIKVLLGWALSILFLLSITFIFYFLIRAKGQRLDTSHQNGYTQQEHDEAVAIVFTAIILIQLFNKFLMKIILQAICKLQMPETTSQFQFSYSFKYTLGLFFTTAVMTLAVEAIQFENYAGEYGVVQQETIMFFFAAFFVNFLWIINPWYYARKLSRHNNYGRQDMTQLQANSLMEDYPYDIGKRYAEIIEIMWFTYLYSSLIPIGAMLALIGFIMYYFIDKYNLLRRSSIANTIESKLSLLSIRLMEMTLVWKPVGQLIFDYQIRETVLPSTIVMLCVACVYMVIPLNKILHICFEEKFNVKTEPFQSVRHRFHHEYQTVDPIQRHLNLQRILKKQDKTGRTFLFAEYEDSNRNKYSSHQESMMEINLAINEDPNQDKKN